MSRTRPIWGTDLAKVIEVVSRCSTIIIGFSKVECKQMTHQPLNNLVEYSAFDREAHSYPDQMGRQLRPARICEEIQTLTLTSRL